MQAAVQAGLVSKPERVVAWAEQELHRKLTSAQRADIVSNVIDEDFFDRARKVRPELGVDYLVGLTAAKVAYEEAREVRWNYFSSLSGRLVSRRPSSCASSLIRPAAPSRSRWGWWCWGSSWSR